MPFFSRPPLGSLNPTRTLMGGVILFDLLVVGLAGWTLARSHRQYVERAEVTTQNLAQVLEGSLIGTLGQVDLVLRAVIDEAERQDIPKARRKVEAHLREQFRRLSILDSLRITDAEGNLDHLQGQHPGPNRGVAVRPFFQQLKQNPESGLLISQPSQDGIKGAWILTLARRLDAPDGAFQGVVFATITLEQLTQELAQVDVGSHGSISLRGADLALLGRYPGLKDQPLALGDTHISGDYLEAVQSGRTVSHFTTHSVLDRQTRTYTFRRVAHPPFYLLVGLAQMEYLQAWRQEAVLSGSAVAALLSLSFVLVWLARSAWRQQQVAHSMIERQETKFRLITENALDVIWTTDKDGNLTYISSSIFDQRGFTPEEMLGRAFYDPSLQGQGSESLKITLDRAKVAPPGSQPFEGELIELELPRTDGKAIQAEIRIRVLWKHDGQLLGLQGATRDITERARLEVERERLIQELTLALAEVKHLKGMLPICSQCKKVRDDTGYWNSIESYLSDHTDATFTHGVCPDCAQELRREMQVLRDQKNKPEEA